MVFILSALWWIRIRGLWKLSDGRGWLCGKLGLFLVSGDMLSKSLIQFSIDDWGCVPSVLFDLRPNYGRNNEDNSNLFQNDMCTHCVQCPWPCNRPLSTHAFTRDSRTLTGRSGSAYCGDTASFSWLLAHTRFYLCPPRVCFPSPWKFCNQITLASKVKFPGASQSLCWIPLGDLLWVLELS